ncbi:hypothetical protein CS8_085250 [Cupriavidus sp. 8B]
MRQAERAYPANRGSSKTASYQGGWYSVISLHGGGTPDMVDRPEIPSKRDNAG